MPRLAANLHTMYLDLPYLDRVTAAADAGFPGVEAFLPVVPAPALRERLEHEAIELIQVFIPAGDLDRGEVGIAIFPDRIAEFEQAVETGVAYAREAGCRRISCLAGLLSSGLSLNQARRTLVRNLRFAADRAAEHGIELLLEPVSNHGPAYFVRTTAQARALIHEVGAPNLRLLYDVFHAQVLEGNLAETIADNLDLIGHIHVADNPGRHEPGTGEIDFDFLLAHVDALRYDGWVGCEYRPLGATDAGLDWAADYLSPRPAGSSKGSATEAR